MRKILNIFLLSLSGWLLQSCDPQSGQQGGDGLPMTQVGNMTYIHRAVALQFTSVGCTGCPAMAEAVKVVRSENRDVFIPLSFHMDYGMADDPLDISVTSLFQRRYGFNTLPYMVMNFRKDREGVAADRFAVADALRTETEEQAQCGVALETEHDDGLLKITTKIATNVEARYRYHVFLVEDGISGFQFGADDQTSYVHDNVVRKMVSSDIFGKNINNHKPVPEGYQAIALDRIALDETWNPRNMRVVAVAMTTYDEGMTWVCANAAECSLGLSADYQAAPSAYQKHIAVWEFTGAWCAFCPEGYDKMNFVISRNEQFNDRVHIMAFHSDSEGADPMALDETEQIRKACEVKDGYPSFLIEMHVSGPLTGETYEQEDAFRKELMKVDEANPAHCGVAVSSVVSDSEAEVKVKVISEKEDNYRVSVFVVENGIVSGQNVASVVDEDYVHDHVVRRVLSSSYRGDRLGALASGQEKEISFKTQLSDLWNIDNTYVYALVLNGNGRVNNMNICKINGGDSPYLIKE